MHGIFQTFYCVLLCLTLLGCSETQRVPLEECGNHIVEQGEDCDGGANCSSSCRFTCEGEKECPAGWGCDRFERVCRTGTAEFKAPALSSESGAAVQAADFDGDGLDDLLATSANGEISSVYYFGRTQTVERSVNLPSANASVTVDLTSDAAPDILLSSDNAVSAFRAMPSRTFSPIVGALAQLPAPAKLLAADLNCDGLREILLLGGQSRASEKTLFRVNATGELSLVGGELSITASELVGLERPMGKLTDTALFAELSATGSFASAGPHRCEMLALPAPPGTLSVDVYASRDGGESIQRVSSVDYSANAEIAKRWFFFDIDGDFYEDLIIASTFGASVSHGFDDGTFEAVATPLNDANGEVFTVGELDGNYGPDFFTSYSSPGWYLQARALDLTGDHITDVAAVGYQRRIDVLRGHESGLSSLLSVPVRGVPHIEDSGDFDGDGLSDLLVSEARETGSLNRTTASVMFAPITSSTAGAVELASFKSIEQMAAGYLTRDDSPQEASQDIGVLFQDKDAALQLGFLEGGADRLLRSRLPTGSREASDYIRYDPAIGYFHTADTREVALIHDNTAFAIGNDSSSPSAQVDLLTVEPNGISYTRRINLPELQLLILYGSSAVQSLDLDLDGLDEIYVATFEGIEQLRGERETFTRRKLLDLDELISQIAVQDANGDGERDLTIASDEGLRVWLAQAGSTGKQSVLIPNTEVSCDVGINGYVFAQVDADPEPELVMSCWAFGIDSPIIGPQSGQPRLDIYDVDLSSGKLRRIRSQAGTASGTLVAGDFNGDGVQDIAGGDPELTVMFGIGNAP